MKMAKKLDSAKKNKILTATLIFVFLFAKGLLEFSRLGKLQVKYIVFVGLTCVALMAFIYVYILPSLMKKIDGKSIVGIVALVHLFMLNISEELIGYNELIYLAGVSIALLLAQNLWALIAASALSIAVAIRFDHAAVAYMPALMSVAAVSFAPLFKKEKPLSKKKAKKVVAPEPAQDNKKEKIIFLACQAVMLATMIFVVYRRRHTVVAMNLKYNYKFYIIPVLICILFAVFAIIAIKSKRTWVETAGYIIPVACLVPAAFSDYYVAVNFGFSLLLMLFMMCGKECLVKEKSDQIFALVSEKINKKSEEEEN